MRDPLPPMSLEAEKPLLLVDVDGVISLFGYDPACPPPGQFQLVDGIPHLLSATAGEHLRALAAVYELAWCTGWEERANEYLPFALGLPGPMPTISFGAAVPTTSAHWKLAAIDLFAGRSRPLAWIDDAHDSSCSSWARARPTPTLLIGTDPAIGLTAEHVETLRAWATSLAGVSRPSPEPGSGA